MKTYIVLVLNCMFCLWYCLQGYLFNDIRHLWILQASVHRYVVNSQLLWNSA